MKAMVLAADEGTRMKPLTLEKPKALLPIGGVPIIVHILKWLKKYGIGDVAINLWYLGDMVKDYLGDGSSLGMKIIYSPEEKILGTAGGLKKMEAFFGGTFVVICGDVLTNLDLGEMLEFHQRKCSLVTIALLPVSNPAEVGIAEVDGDRRILSFVEKPKLGSKVGNLASGGIYVFESQIFRHIPDNRFCDFAYDVFPELLQQKLPVFGYILKPDAYLMDVGTMSKYRKADEDVAAGKVDLN